MDVVARFAAACAELRPRKEVAVSGEVLVNKSGTLLGRTTQRLRQLAEDAVEGAADAAAENVELATKVLRIEARAEAYSTVLESTGKLKEELEERMKGAKGAHRVLLQRHIEMVSAQEEEVLRRAGASPERLTASGVS